MSQPEPAGPLHTPTSSQDASPSVNTAQAFSYSQPTHTDAMLLGSQYQGTQGSSQVLLFLAFQPGHKVVTF